GGLRARGWPDVDDDPGQMRHAGDAFELLRTVSSEQVDVHSGGFAGDAQSRRVLVAPAVRQRDGAGHQVLEQAYRHAYRTRVGGDVGDVAVAQAYPCGVDRVHVEKVRVAAAGDELRVVVRPRVVRIDRPSGDELEPVGIGALALEVVFRLPRLLEQRCRRQ